MMRWTLESMGFNVQIMPLPEVYLAIQQGAVGGQENPIDTIYANKFYEVAPNVTLTKHVYSPIPLTISEKTWQKLSAGRPRGGDRRRRKEAAAWSRNEISGQRRAAARRHDGQGREGRAARARRRSATSVKPAYAKAKEKYGADVDAILADAEAVRKAVPAK